MIAEWILMLAMNGWTTPVDRFTTAQACREHQQTFERALRQSQSTALVWCEPARTEPGRRADR